MMKYNGKTAREWYDQLSDNKARTFGDILKWDEILYSQYGIKDALDLAYKLALIELAEILLNSYDEGLIAYNVGEEMRRIAEGTEVTR